MLEKLTTLLLYNNQITELVAGVFDGLVSLTSLDLRKNRIVAVVPFARRQTSLSRACTSSGTSPVSGLCTFGNPVAGVDSYYGTFEPSAKPTEITATPTSEPTEKRTVGGVTYEMSHLTANACPAGTEELTVEECRAVAEAGAVREPPPPPLPPPRRKSRRRGQELPRHWRRPRLS